MVDGRWPRRSPGAPSLGEPPRISLHQRAHQVGTYPRAAAARRRRHRRRPAEDRGTQAGTEPRESASRRASAARSLCWPGPLQDGRGAPATRRRIFVCFSGAAAEGGVDLGHLLLRPPPGAQVSGHTPPLNTPPPSLPAPPPFQPPPSSLPHSFSLRARPRNAVWAGSTVTRGAAMPRRSATTWAMWGVGSSEGAPLRAGSSTASSQ